MSNHSKRAIWLAVNSEHGDRLVEIAQEHTSLALEIAEYAGHMTEDVKDILSARIGALRIERDRIISQFEGR